MSKSYPAGLYRLISACLLPVFVVHAIVRSCKDGKLRYLTERLGNYKHDSTPRIWLHAASVGEVRTALPLVQTALANDTSLQFLVTTNTPTGYQQVRDHLLSQYPNRILHRYLPIDTGFISNRLFSQHRIEAAWVLETELWPWLYANAEKHSTPITIINGRLTNRTMKAAKSWLGVGYKKALSAVKVLARSESDAGRFIKLGAQPSQVHVVGDLKFADNNQGGETRLISPPYAIAASTHANEELMLARSWLDVSTHQLLVIAPRHAERGPAIYKELVALCRELNLDEKSVLAIARSTGGEPTDQTRLYLADTLGEMSSWYAHAKAAFVGGSLIPRGGHNVLEPMHLSVPIVTGMHMENFTDACKHLQKFEAVQSVESAEEVSEFLFAMMTDADRRENAKAAVSLAASQIESIIPRYLELLHQKFNR